MPAILYLVSGKIAAGKSTLTASLAKADNTIKIGEDDWLAALFSDQMETIQDYVRCSEKLRAIIEPHVVSLLQLGMSVVLDFPANTAATRVWMRRIAESADVAHELHYLDVPNDVCKARLHKRNADGDHAFAVTGAQFDQITKHFEPPHPNEGFNIVHHTQ